MTKVQFTVMCRVLLRGPRYWPIWRYSFIDGWLGVREAVALHDLAAGLPGNEPVVVEIGSWVGKSSLVLAQGLRKKTAPVLYCIDPFNAVSDAESHLPEAASLIGGSLRAVFEGNLRRAGADSVVRVLQGMSFDVRPQFSTPIDLLFIDGDHSYEGVVKDYLDWAPLVKKGGIIAFHDVGINPAVAGPLKVVMEKLWHDSEWGDFQHIQTLYCATKRR
jgi:MMP 1-O-methyltransferase